MRRLRFFCALFAGLALGSQPVAGPVSAATKASRSVTKPARTSTTQAPRTTLPVRTTTTTTVPPTTVRGRITVFAASSLTAPFTEIAAAFEQAHPAAKVTLNFAGSSTLATQITNGAPADLFASADIANMDRLVAAKLVADTPAIFTRNRLMIVVPKGNPLRVQGLADLARSEVFVALGAPGVPAGDYAREVLRKAGVTVNPKTLESNVAAMVTKAALKEIDAAIVYVTDVALDDYRVDGVAIPDAQNIVATYPIAVLSDARNPSAATAFDAFTRSTTAQHILKRHKFLPLP